MRMAHFTAAIHMAEKSALRTSGPWFNCCQTDQTAFPSSASTPSCSFGGRSLESGNRTTTDFEEHSSSVRARDPLPPTIKMIYSAMVFGSQGTQ